MKRLVISALLAMGCGNAQVEKDLAAAVAEENQLKAAVGDAAQVLAGAERVQEDEGARLTRATRSLANQQAVAARRWEGNAKKLQQLKKDFPMPAPLLAALDAAHASGKDATPEKRFEQSLSAGKLTDAAALLEGWEAAEFSYEEPDTSEGCMLAEIPDLKCRQDARQGVLLCDGAENTWVMWSEHGQLYTMSAPSVGLEVEGRPAPGIWIFKAKAGGRNVFESRTGSYLLTWVATLPQKSQLTWKNLDEDPFMEGVLEDNGDVRYFDIIAAHAVNLQSELDSCRTLGKLGALPDSAKAGCKTREAAAASTADAGH